MTSSVLNSGGHTAESEPAENQPSIDDESSSTDVELLKSNGNKAFKNGDFRRAKHLYDSALKISPDNPQLLSNRCLCLLRLSRKQEALADAERAIAANPAWAKAWARKAEALSAMDMFDESAAAMQRALQLEPATTDFAALLRAARARA